jgi:hypothetical protein
METASTDTMNFSVIDWKAEEDEQISHETKTTKTCSSMLMKQKMTDPVTLRT